MIVAVRHRYVNPSWLKRNAMQNQTKETVNEQPLLLSS
jgi:hypothetical protein